MLLTGGSSFHDAAGQVESAQTCNEGHRAVQCTSYLFWGGGANAFVFWAAWEVGLLKHDLKVCVCVCARVLAHPKSKTWTSSSGSTKCIGIDEKSLSSCKCLLPQQPCSYSLKTLTSKVNPPGTLHLQNLEAESTPYSNH